MKKFFCCCLLAVVASVTVSAQITDSLGKVCLVPAAGEGGFARYIDRRTSTKGYRMTFIAAPLIVGGAVMSVYDTDFRRLRNGYVKSFHHDYDDYLQYAPAAVMLGLKAFGVKGRSSWGRMLVSDAFSVGLMAAAVNSLKYSFRVMRPDGSTRNSFPSGHTATVFMTATMLHKEYGHRSPWYSIGAYTVATVTGVTRQLNNRHWMSDVMVGAGIGILATEFGYFLADLIFKDKGRTSFKAGPTVGAQGAWFASPYVGVGGRFAVTNLEMTVNGVPQDDNLESGSAAAGLYLSYPLSVRWLVGSKLLSGYGYYKSCNTDLQKLGDRGGFVLATGISSTYLASRNFGIRFSTDYDMAPPFAKDSRQRLHMLTFSLAACAVF